jgi:hypothetical protein
MTINLRRAEPNDYPAVNDLATALVECAADRRASFQAVLAHADHDLILAAQKLYASAGARAIGLQMEIELEGEPDACES